METSNAGECRIHYVMSIVGGFLGAYAVLNRVGNLGSAQTANLIIMVINFLGHDFSAFIIRVFGMILYFAAIEAYVLLKNKTKVNMKVYAASVVAVGCLVLNFIPQNINDPVIGLLPLFFMMATQWSVFHGTKDYNSSTIFSTNNFRQASLAIGEYLTVKDKPQIKKAKFFGMTLLMYHIGVAASFFACMKFGVHASLFCLIPLAAAFELIFKEIRIKNRAAVNAA